MDIAARSSFLSVRVSIARGATAATTSGDCVQVVSRLDGVTLCFVGDVTGHDSIAVDLATSLGPLVRDMARWMSPATVLTNLNAAIEATWPIDRLASAICFSLDARTGNGFVALAGQYPPLIKRSLLVEQVESTAGPVLGFYARQTYGERAFFLHTNDVLVSVTDGITDPMAMTPDFLGLSTLTRLVAAADGDPRTICRSLVRVAGHLGLRDDATVLAVATAGGTQADRAVAMSVPYRRGAAKRPAMSLGASRASWPSRLVELRRRGQLRQAISGNSIGNSAVVDAGTTRGV